MKYTLPIIAILTLFSCGSKDTTENNPEKETAELFEKEYTEFKDSPSYKAYELRYEELCRLSDEAHLMDLLVSDKTPITDTLCFEVLPNEHQRMDNKQTIQNTEPVNAVIVSTQFCRGERGTNNTFASEADLHQAANALHKEKFVAQCKKTDSSATYIHQQFTKAKNQINTVNNAKYFVILKVRDRPNTSILNKNEASASITIRFFYATVYIYNLEKKRVQYAVDFQANSTPQLDEYELQQSIDDYMQENINIRLKTVLDSAIGIKGNLPIFKVSAK